MRRKQISILFVFLILSTWAGAQEKLSLDIQSAKDYALNFNKSIKNSGLAIEQSQEKIREAIASGLPQVNATTDYTNALGAEISIQFDESLPPTKIPIKPTSNFNLQVGQLIFNGSFIVGVQTAKIYKKITEKGKEKTEQEIVSQLVESYYLALLSEEALTILSSNVENLTTVYNKTKPMVSVGMMEKVELDQLEVQLNSLNNSVKAAERQLEMAKNVLRFQLGVDSETELELTDKLADILADSNIQSMIGDDFNIVNNVDFQLTTLQEEISAKQVELQKAAYLPSLTGYYSFTKKILKPAFDMSPANVVGMQMNIPVFSSGERRSKVRQAKIDLETTQNNKEILEDQLTLQYKQLKFNLISAFEAYATQKRSVEVSREVYNSLRNKYDQGMISSLDLTSADNNYLNAESNYISAMMEVLKAQNDLNTLTGTILN
ncbi:MAG: TolC family protein [Draconibacterium sp.]